MKYIKTFESFSEDLENKNPGGEDADMDDITLEKGQVDLAVALKYMLAGKFVGTFVNSESRTHLTYKIRRTSYNPNMYFVSALNGKDNDKDYKYFGLIRDNGIMPTFEYAKKAAISKDSKSVVAFDFIFDKIIKIANNRTYLGVKEDKPIIVRNIKDAFYFKTLAEAQKYIDNVIVNENGQIKKYFYILKKASIYKNLELWHSSNCARCGRTLTVKDSIIAGMGSMCIWLTAMKANKYA